MFEVFRRAIKHNLAALLAGARTHINHAVSRQHNGRVMLNHHQCIASIAQAVHGLSDAVHITRMQANRRLVQHKQRVDQRCTQCRCQVDALDFAARQGTALPVQSEVANADITQVLQARLDFFKQGFERLLFCVVTHRGQREAC